MKSQPGFGVWLTQITQTMPFQRGTQAPFGRFLQEGLDGAMAKPGGYTAED